jgi:hypothetical protein
MECSATPGHCIPWISPHGRIGGWTILLDAQGPGNGQNPIYLSHDSGLTWTAQTGGPTNLTSYWNERKAHETGVVPISSGYTLGFWRGREERGQAQFL